MAPSMRQRPFENFRVAITDPKYYFGRREIIQTIASAPFQVNVLLGGRRFGKTSTLHAIQWALIDSNGRGRAFPVYINLRLEQPRSVDHFRFLLIARLRENIDRMKRISSPMLHDAFRQIVSHIDTLEVGIKWAIEFKIKFRDGNASKLEELDNAEFRHLFLLCLSDLRRSQYNGICFLLDEAEVVTKDDWANDAWSYFRALKDTDEAIRPFLGLVLSGYRDLRAYQQRTGSPLRNIANVIWLRSLSISQVQQLTAQRRTDENAQPSKIENDELSLWAGGHPYLVQQMLNLLIDRRQNEQYGHIGIITSQLMRQHREEFSKWWNLDQKSNGFDSKERYVYKGLVSLREGNIASVALETSLSFSDVEDALDVLAGTGLIRQIEGDRYCITTRLFEEWVLKQGPPD